MPQFNTVRCCSPSVFSHQLQNLSLELDSTKNLDVEKVREWINNNWVYLQNGHSVYSLFQFRVALWGASILNKELLKVENTLMHCLTPESYFQILPKDILSSVVCRLDNKSNAILLKSSLNPETTQKIKIAFIEALNRGISPVELGMNDVELKGLLKEYKDDVTCLSLRISSIDLAVQLRSFPHLNSVGFRHTLLEFYAIDVQLNFPNISNIRRLDLTGNQIKDEGAKLVAQAEPLANLESLDLTANFIGSEGMRALANSPVLARLTSLNMTGNKCDAEGAQALIHSNLSKRLRSLDLSHNPIEVEQVEPLRAALAEAGIELNH